MAIDTEIPSRQLVFQGMELFRQGDVKGSIEKFDASVSPGSKAYLWQRGLSLYYADRFEDASRQVSKEKRFTIREGNGLASR